MKESTIDYLYKLMQREARPVWSDEDVPEVSPAPLVIVVNGPIASGKSTVALALAALLRERGRSAAVIDLDTVYAMLDPGPKADAEVWRLARRGAAALTGAFLAAGRGAVIVEGDFWTAAERGVFRRHLMTPATPCFVTLRVSFGEALRRVRGDPSRGLSRDPAFLARNHADFAAQLEPLRETDLVLDTTDATPLQLATAIAAACTGAPPSVPT